MRLTYVKKRKLIALHEYVSFSACICRYWALFVVSEGVKLGFFVAISDGMKSLGDSCTMRRVIRTGDK